MCLLVVASQLVAGEPLIVGANRDEILERPSTSITVLDAGPPRILGGRDELSGGTWLAVNEHGVCAGLTNQPLGEAKDPSKRSRGELPLALARHATAPAAVEACWGPTGRRTTTARGCSWATAARCSSSTSPGRAPAPRSPSHRGSTCWRTGGWASRRSRSTWFEWCSATPSAATRWSTAFRRVLADHRIPEGEERPNAANCVHLESFGTRSSCLVRVADGNDPPRMWVADGPPCATPYVEVSGLWEASRGRPAGADGSAPDERLVAQPVGLVGLDPETLVPIGFVVAEVALPPARPRTRPRRRARGWQCGRGTSGRG